MRNEMTSPGISSIAGKILSQKRPAGVPIEDWENIKKLAGSTLTQTADKKHLSNLDPKIFSAIRGISSLKRLKNQKP